MAAARFVELKHCYDIQLLGGLERIVLDLDQRGAY
jgi:hypothetical protein